MTKKEKELIKECLEDRIRGLRLDQDDLIRAERELEDKIGELEEIIVKLGEL